MKIQCLIYLYFCQLCIRVQCYSDEHFLGSLLPQTDCNQIEFDFLTFVSTPKTIYLIDTNFNSSEKDIQVKQCILKAAIELKKTILRWRSTCQLSHDNTLVRTVPFTKYMRMFQRTQTDLGFIIFADYKTINSQHLLNSWEIMSRRNADPFVFILDDNSDRCRNLTLGIEKTMKLFFRRLWVSSGMIRVIARLQFLCKPLYVIHEPSLWTSNNYGYGIRYVDVKTRFDLLEVSVNKKLHNGYRLKISIFPRTPTSITKPINFNRHIQKALEPSENVSGLDGFIMADILRHFNFKPIFIKPPASRNRYGYVKADGVTTGSLADVTEEIVDISFNSRFLMDYGTAGFRFLNYMGIDHVCGIVKQAKEIPIWMAIFTAFQINVWYLILVFTISTYLVRLITRKIFPYNIRSIKGDASIDTLLLQSLKTFLAMPLASKFHPKEKLIILLCLLFNVMFVALFGSNIQAVLIAKRYYKEIDTLDELYASGLPIATSYGYRNLFKFSDNQLYRDLDRKIILNNKTSTLDTLLNLDKHEAAVMYRRSDMGILLSNVLIGRNGEPLVHIMKECVKPYYLAYIVRENFPFDEDLNRLIQRLNEAGLPSWYYEYTKFMLTINAVSHKYNKRRLPSPLTMGVLRVAFFVLLAGVMASLAVFAAEVSIAMRKRKIQKTVAMGEIKIE